MTGNSKQSVGVVLDNNQASWLTNFEQEHGRPLRVLHVGNIANNAYLNSKFLRAAGVDAHVLSYDYYHVMSTPEWEEIELLKSHGDDNFPEFSESDLDGYRRPKWFVDGPLSVCGSEIAELRSGRPLPVLRARRLFYKKIIFLSAKYFGSRFSYATGLLLTDPRLLANKIVALLVSSIYGRKKYSTKFLSRQGKAELSRLINLFETAFPDRQDRLKPDDVAFYQSYTRDFRKIFQGYDIVQCYATEPIHALLANKIPNVAFEHGTLRDFTMSDAPLHRLTSLSYRCAAHTFITNGDCREYADLLGIKNHSPIVHPVDVEQHRQDFGLQIQNLRHDIGGDVILFCPIRHDWKVKGTDVHLRALPIIKEKIGRNVKLVLIRWGAQIADSENLLSQLGCGNDVVWRPSMCRVTMIKHIQAADVVLDQMALPHFGSTAPQSIATGVPVVSSYIPESTRYIMPEAAPILPAFTPDEVCDAVIQALDHSWRIDFKKRAVDWTDKYHHPNNVVFDHLKVYMHVLDKNRELEKS